MVKAFRSGLSRLDLFSVPERDQAKVNAERLQRIWEKELRKKKPSLIRALWIFSRTRVIVAYGCLIVSVFLQFLGPVRSLMK